MPEAIRRIIAAGTILIRRDPFYPGLRTLVME
jgi:hypothetical protein